MVKLALAIGRRSRLLRAAELGFEGSLTQMPREPAAGDRGWWPWSVYEPAWQQKMMIDLISGVCDGIIWHFVTESKLSG